MSTKQVNDSFIDDFFGGGTGEPITAPVEDTTIVDQENVEDVVKKSKEKTILSQAPSDLSLAGLLDVTIVDEDDDDDEDAPKPVAVDKDDPIVSKPKEGTVDYKTVASKLIEDEILIGFEEGTIESIEDLKELIQANLEEREQLGVKTKFQEVYDSMPEEVQQAIEYVANGGKDIRQMLKKLSNIVETKEIDVTTESGQKETIKQYLLKTQFGTEEDIDDQITEWDDLGVLDKKANNFKPKLEALATKEAQEEIKRQETNREKQQGLLRGYYEGIESSIKEGKINSIPLTPDEKNKIYKGLTENNYTSSISGKPINYLGKFIEDITWNSPDYVLLSELTLFALDPAKYKEKIEKGVTEKTIADTKRRLNRGDDKPVETDKQVTIKRKSLLSR